MECKIDGCDNIREKKGHYPSGIQKYSALCSHHNYLKSKGLPVDYKARPVRDVFRGGFVRGVCAIPNCNRLQISKGRRYGLKRYDIYCAAHHSLERQGLPMDMNLEHCSICGWVGPCDKHRLKGGKDGGEYTIENVIIVCPNCHRDYHRGVDPCRRLPKQTA